MRRKCWLALFCAVTLGACGGPIAPPDPPTGQMIAFGAGPSARDACFQCHGFEGEGREQAPRLAGLDHGYVAKQLEDYASELRPDEVMTPIAQRLTARERRAVADYYAGMAAPARSAANPPPLWRTGDAARGIRPCAECHQSGDGPTLTAQPRLYTIEQLQRWRAGKRRNDPLDVMGRATQALTDAEIEALATYLEQSS